MPCFFANSSPCSTKIFFRNTFLGFFIFNELEKLEEEIGKVVVELVPLKKEDIETFSTKQVQRNSKKRFTYNVRGAFASIFEEPLFKYAYRQYLSGKNDALLLAITKKHRFHYWVQAKGVLVFIDDQLLGTYTPKDGALTGSRSNKVIAQIEKHNLERVPFKIQNKISHASTLNRIIGFKEK